MKDYLVRIGNQERYFWLSTTTTETEEYGPALSSDDPVTIVLEWLGLDADTHLTSRQIEDATAFVDVICVFDWNDGTYHWDWHTPYEVMLHILCNVYPSLLCLPGIHDHFWPDLYGLGYDPTDLSEA